MYIAKCYTTINGELYKKGDIVPEGLPEEKIEWLTKADAIEEIPSAPSVQGKTSVPAAEEQEELDEFPFPEVLQDPEDGAPEDEGEDPEEDEEAPEIDVMAGIVQEPAEEPEKPARAKAPKKTAERRKQK